MISATEHDKYVDADYVRLAELGITTIREGVRWHLIEPTDNHFNFSSVLPMIRAAQKNGIQVIWDLCHFGWPDEIDIFKPEFIHRFARFSREFLQVLKNETDSIPFITPINEISYFSWACGEIGYMHPFEYAQGHKLKLQLVKATIEATEAIWSVAPESRIVNVDPAIHVIHDPSRPHEKLEAIKYNELQHETRDMLLGRVNAELGGAEKYLDIVGINFYPFNQWIYGNSVDNLEVILSEFYPLYKPLNILLEEIYERYQRPILISETGTEGKKRAEWLNYLVSEIRIAHSLNIPVEGLCWYPIVNNPHWDDDRHCHNGLWDYADETGNRIIHEPLANAFREHIESFKLKKESKGFKHNPKLSYLSNRR